MVQNRTIAKAETIEERVRLIMGSHHDPSSLTTKTVMAILEDAGTPASRSQVSKWLNVVRREDTSQAVETPEDAPEDTAPTGQKLATYTPQDTKRPSLRWLSVSAAGVVALVAAIASYSHMRDVALLAGQGDMLAYILPLSVDGLLIVASVALVDGETKRGIAWISFLCGSAASLAANVISADPDILSRCVSAWPVVALGLTVEILLRKKK